MRTLSKLALSISFTLTTLSACGVDQPDDPLHGPPHRTTEPTDVTDTPAAAQVDDATEPQPCLVTADCDGGVCDRDTLTCISFDPVTKHSHQDDDL
jgi:hypothetical protein